MDTTDQIPDGELLISLRMDFMQALQRDDFSRINRVILPLFLGRFRQHYEEYARNWKSVSVTHGPVRLVIDPHHREEMEIEWAEHVLKGEIDLTL
jgi:hypothetical protein